jgi:F-type H+-transporting ATPase subunit a
MAIRHFLISSLATVALALATFSVNAQHHIDSAAHQDTLQHVDTVTHDANHADTVAHTEAHGEEKFNASELILEHIADSHDWHLWGHTSVHLPVILYTDKGIECFSSGNFDHGHKAYTGKYYTYAMHHEKIEIVDPVTGDPNHDAHVYDFSITKNVASLMLSVFLLIVIFLSVASAYKKREGKAPKGFQSMIEPIIIFIRDEVARPNLGRHYRKFLPFLLTIFFFIWINNMLGIIPFFPGGANVTGNIAVTMVLAVVTFVIININGNKIYWKHVFTPHVPLWLYPLMIPVEIIGLFTKPFALMIRLFANITAGHILILSLISLIFIFKAMWVASIAVPFVIFISVIELLVAFLQAFIFTMLAALFIGMAVENEHEEH